MASNKKLGNEFELEFCERLCKHGFWVHNLAQNQAGQPADIIAVKNRIAYLIDCKVCSSNRFLLSRVEDNQHLAMEMWKSCGNGEAWFALKAGDEIYMVSLASIEIVARQKASMNLADIRKYGVLFDLWLEIREDLP